MANYVSFPRIAAGEAVTVPFDVDEDITGWTLRAYYGPRRNDSPWITKATTATGADQISIGPGTGGTGSFVLTSTDTGRTLGPGIWPFSIWRTDVNLQARLAWGEQVILSSIADAVT